MVDSLVIVTGKDPTKAMANPESASNSANPAANLLGFYAAVVTSVVTLITFGIAILTPPLSGPNCREGCFEYPYADIASRFPRDYYWMYPAMVMAVLFVILMACIHQYASHGRKVFSLIGLSFALISAAILLVDYFVQVSVIQPSIENGETDGIALLTQFNPHGLFIALEDIGYLVMSVAFLFMAPVFMGKNRLESALRWLFSVNFVLTMIALIALSLMHGVDREYRFEVIALSINWIVLIVSGILLSVVFRRDFGPK